MNKKLLIALGCASMVICGCEKENVIENPSIELTEGEKFLYSTKDNKFELKIVELDDTMASKDYYEGEKKFNYDIATSNCKNNSQYDFYGKNYDCSKLDEEFDTIFKENFSVPDGIKKFGYLNSHFLAIESVHEDDVYVSYKGYFVENIRAQYQESFLIEKATGTIIESPDNTLPNDVTDENEWLVRFNGESSTSLDYVKTGIGYFIIGYTPANNIIYTTDMKQIGYVDNVKEDTDGIYVYDNMALEGTPSKYNVNGEKIS